jgi:hypothetical protein
MKQQDAQFNDILNLCLDRLFKGETVERCLQDYPAQAQELEPLLRTAKAARVVSEIQPRPDFKARARYEFQAELNALAQKKSRTRSFNWFPRWRWQSGWAVALIVFLVVVLGGGGTVAAASASMPDSPLYSLKRATENVELAVTFSDVNKAALNARFANRRTAEIGYLAAQGDAQGVQIIAQALNTNLTNITQITAQNLSHTTATLDTGAVNGSDQRGSQTAESADMNRNNLPPMLNTAIPTPSVALAPPVFPTPSVAVTAAGTAPATEATAPDNSGKAATTSSTPQMVVPAITVPPVTVPPGPVPAPAGSGNTYAASSESTFGGSVALTPEGEQLKKIIEDNYQQRQAELQKILDNAPLAVRPAIRQAIAQSQSEYEQAITNLYAGYLAG